MGERLVRFDDLDGTEDGTVETHRFTWGGVTYRIDLSAANFVALFKAVEPFFKAARPEDPSRGPRRAAERRTRVARGLGLPRVLALQEASTALALAEGESPLRLPKRPAAKAAAPELPHQRQPEPAPDVPMSGGFGEYTWESDGTMPPTGTTYATTAEMNAAARWTYALMGKSVKSRQAVEAFRAQDSRRIPGYAPVPKQGEVKTAVGKALVKAENGKRAKEDREKRARKIPAR